MAQSRRRRSAPPPSSCSCPACWPGWSRGGFRVGNFCRHSSIRKRRAPSGSTVDRRAFTRARRTCFARFALQGLGTPAPIAPPQHLVVTGLYRYVRNPMYVAVVAVILGQAILFGDFASHDLRRAHVARLPRLCPGVRGAGACSEVWGPVRGFSGQRSAVDSAAVSMARRIRPPAQWRRRGERGPDRSTLNLVVRRKP